jgi:hypothetical protein
MTDPQYIIGENGGYLPALLNDPGHVLELANIRDYGDQELYNFNLNFTETLWRAAEKRGAGIDIGGLNNGPKIFQDFGETEAWNPAFRMSRAERMMREGPESFGTFAGNSGGGNPSFGPRIDIADRFKFFPSNPTAGRMQHRLHYMPLQNHSYEGGVNPVTGMLELSIEAGDDPLIYGSGRDMFYTGMQRFQAEGIEINGIHGRWLNYISDDHSEVSTNYLQYERAIKGGMDPIQAALSTWTGKRAVEYGFSKVKVSRNSQYAEYVGLEMVNAYFLRK